MIKIVKKIYRGQSLARILMNLEAKKYTLRGRVVDVGGGRKPDYFNFFKGKDYSVEVVDGSVSGINFEKNQLPFEEQSIDQVLVMNVLEHIYNYRFLVGEMVRILKFDGELLGFVPFLINYHPDPHDYFRYTKESLQKILEEAGVEVISITEVGRGPLSVNYNNIMLSLPIIFRTFLLPVYWSIDMLIIKIRPNLTSRYPLGYFFYAKKTS